MKTLRILSLAAVSLLMAACGPVRLTVLNNSGGEIKDLKVELNGETWTAEEMAHGQSIEREFKIKEKTTPRLNFLNANGQRIYGSASLVFKKRQSGKVTLVVNSRNLIEVKRKGKQEKRKY